MLKLILAGILALPCFLLFVVTAPVIALLAIPPLLVLIYRRQPSDNNDKLSSRTAAVVDHVIIIGGSSGIGKSIAQECVKRGDISKLTLLARNKDKLQETKESLETLMKQNKDYGAISKSKTTEISTHSVSVSDYKALQSLAPKILSDKTEESSSPPPRVVLFNCAGISYTTEFEKVPIEEYMRLIETNQLGAMYVCKAFLPFLHRGTIVLTSSAAAQVGVYGYSIYSPTKYALRGFAETMHAELVRSKPELAIQIAFPADTNTPGYEAEAKMMPPITKALNESAGLANPDDTAKEMIKSAFSQNPKFAVYFNLEGWMLTNLTAGMSPVCNLLDAICQIALPGIFRFVSLFVLNDWWTIIRNFSKEDNDKDDNNNNKKKDTTSSTSCSDSNSSPNHKDKVGSKGD